ncbi:hypothetical protein SAY86_030899 [Trapa natans]|uniref:Uncharacterized protein n=1 Tax=Trapa natans TaxID=22666 RepID=A0AAN7RIY8_TRANT|nr:hypothetical protein SAY86_030899 [Trapa natans]
MAMASSLVTDQSKGPNGIKIISPAHFLLRRAETGSTISSFLGELSNGGPIRVPVVFFGNQHDRYQHPRGGPRAYKSRLLLPFRYPELLRSRFQAPLRFRRGFLRPLSLISFFYRIHSFIFFFGSATVARVGFFT